MAELAIHGGAAVLEPGAGRFSWPVITPSVERAVLEQLHSSISIYNRSGVFEEFEDAFATYHNSSHALLFNSGTSALLAMFQSVGLGPGDEVLAPVYTFHATASPLMSLGVRPVFCDSDNEGNVSLEQIANRISNRTRAVVVTHMWGSPARDIRAIAELCDGRRIPLLEDCSHAHGAMIDGRRVGTFGTAAAWSLQGQKIVTGGEGGVLVTSHDELYWRALLFGHYNKRPQQEIPDDSDLRRYYLTGMGLKLRAHPLAIAIALEQFVQLDDFLTVKQRHAEMLRDALTDYDFLEAPETATDGRQHSWYGFNILFHAEHAGEVTRSAFCDALIAEGLSEADIPGSTGLLDTLPLFTEPEGLLPHLYMAKDVSLPRRDVEFPMAQRYYESVIKFPVWAFESDRWVVEKYAEGIRKVADVVKRSGEL